MAIFGKLDFDTRVAVEYTLIGFWLRDRYRKCSGSDRPGLEEGVWTLTRFGKIGPTPIATRRITSSITNEATGRNEFLQ